MVEYKVPTIDFTVVGCTIQICYSQQFFNHPLIHSFIHSLFYSPIHSFTLLFTHSFIHSFTHSFTHSFIYSLMQKTKPPTQPSSYRVALSSVEPPLKLLVVSCLMVPAFKHHTNLCADNENVSTKLFPGITLHVQKDA